MTENRDHIHKGEANLFTILSHELKSSITLIQGLSEILKGNPAVAANKELVELVGYINATSNHSHKLLKNVLNWSFLQNGKINFQPDNISVREIVNSELNALETSFKRKEIRVTSSIPDEIIFADKHLLEIVIRNLLSNAVKYSFRGGLINVSFIAYFDFYEFSISDTGKGMDENTKKRLFKSSVVESVLGTENEEGTGLGLILCKEFVEKHNGKLWVNSELSKGCQFKFIIPNGGVII